MIEERKRPMKMFEVVLAYGPYRVGDRIQPTGIYRSQLLARGIIKEVADDAHAVAGDRQAGTVQQPLENRMVDLAGEAPALTNRKRGGAR